MSAVLQVVSGGVLTTVQDLGRPDAARYGVPLGGAMDRFALRAANRLLGNPPGAAALEITAGGAAFTILQPTALAVTGADLGATLNERTLPLWTAVAARPGDQVALPGRRGAWGGRAYLALRGGLDLPLVLGSRGAFLPGGFGGLEGRALRAGDVLAAIPAPGEASGVVGRAWPMEARPPYGPEPTLRLLPGPHEGVLGPDALTALVGTPLRVGAAANRMGYRLDGALAPYAQPVSLASLGVIPGAIQVPPDGRPILLMADAQTTGGYPILGVVIAPDLPLAAQLLPGDPLRLAPVDEAEAVEARRALAGWEASTLELDPAYEALALAGAPG